MFEEEYRRTNDAIHAPAQLKQAAKDPPAKRASPRRRLPRMGGLVAAAVVIALLLGLPFGGGSPTGFASASAAYVAEYPDALTWDDFYNYDDSDFDWGAASDALDAYRDSIRVDPDYLAALAPFTLDSLRAALGGGEGENGVYSPLALYLALAMCAELTDGPTRQQLLDVLGVFGLSRLRDQTNRLWNSVHRDSQVSRSLLAGSLWLNADEEYQFKEAPLTTLRDTYYTSSYVADMADDDTQAAIHDWLNEQTGGLLADEVDAVEVDAGTVALLLSAVWFQDQWITQFNEERTAPGTFHRADGRDVTCDFMHMTTLGSYVGADGFTSTALSFEGGGSMTFILPDEGMSADDLLADDALMERILANHQGSPEDDPDLGYGEIQLSVPKFSVTASLDLIPLLQELGITDLFDYNAADFTPLSDYPLLYIERATQSTTLSIDEIGCTAASFVEMGVRAGAGMPAGLCVLDLDRPFLFLVSGVEGVPLFVGVVNDPTA